MIQPCTKPLQQNFFLLLFIFFIVAKSQAQQTINYPRVTGYFSVVNSIGTISKNGFTSNFSKVYTVGFPFGINILKSDHFGVSFEVAPAIRTENNISKVSTVLFHPGAMFRFQHGFTFIGRLAFETNGRFGFTPVFNQIIKRGKAVNYFLSVAFPTRFGNALPATLGASLQLGVSF